MASSSSTPRTWKYSVFTSFHGPDVRKTLLSHLRKQFKLNGITMFDDQGIERSQVIAPALTGAIRESRISIVVLSKNYASSSWCLDELLDILKCKEDIGQIVMTVFYGVDPSDVRKQMRDFGIAFSGTCAHKTEEERRKWSQALTYVGNIAGEDFENWDNEENMIEKIARDVSEKLNATPSNDFDDMVGLEAHLRKVDSLLDLDNDGVKIVGISGPAGIGKSTIARSLHGRHLNSFTLSCFMDNQDLRRSYHNGSDEYSSRLQLQEQFLSKILNLTGIKILHLGVLKNRLHNQKVLIILDDVERLDQLEVLANIMWFGHGSRVIVTTENKEILQQHGINDIYHVGFPSRSEALMIFCLSAFRQTSPPDGFMNLAYEVASICGDLPLGLHVLGSSLRGKSQADWIDELPRLKNSLDGKIESVLKVGYEGLHEKDQALFLFIAVFFNYNHVDHVISMLEESNLNVRYGMKVLANKHLIDIDHGPERRVVMHHLLQVMARQVISKQEPWKRQILVDARQICYVLENAEDNGSVIGVSFDVAESNKLKINTRSFERMYNLFFLKVYNESHIQQIQWHIPEDIEFPSRLRLLRWDAYPKKSLPLRFCAENLVKLKMPYSELEKLWEGTQLLANLKKINLSGSSRLKELPDLSKATNLERLDVYECIALVELPSPILNLYELNIRGCESLEVIPRLVNLVSTVIDMQGCSRLRSLPDLPTKVRDLCVTGTAVEELPESLTYCSHLEFVDLSVNGNLKAFLTELPTSVRWLALSESGIERITDSIIVLHNLRVLDISECKRLVSLPELPCSLEKLDAKNCESLERISGSFNTPNAELDFSNCFKLDQKALQVIIQQSFVRGVFPGSKVPARFNKRARGNSLTIPFSDFNRIKVCVVISPHHQPDKCMMMMMRSLLCRCRVIGDSVNYTTKKALTYGLQREHVCIFDIDLSFIDPGPSEVRRKIVLEFSTRYVKTSIFGNNTHKLEDWDTNLEITECGVEILMDETNRKQNGEDNCSDESDEASDKEEDDNDTIANGRSESGQVLDKEDDEEGYKSEYGEASNNKVDDIANEEDEYQSVSRKRKMTSATTHLRKGIQRPGFKKKKRKMNHTLKKFRHCIGTSGQKKAKRAKY